MFVEPSKTCENTHPAIENSTQNFLKSSSSLKNNYTLCQRYPSHNLNLINNIIEVSFGFYWSETRNDLFLTLRRGKCPDVFEPFTKLSNRHIRTLDHSNFVTIQKIYAYVLHAFLFELNELQKKMANFFIKTSEEDLCLQG